jgi:chromosome segregation ATPase
MNKHQLTEKINELSAYLASAQKVVDNYKNQISELEEKRAELLDAGFKPVFGRVSESGQ